MAPAIVSRWGQQARDVGDHLERTKKHVDEACRQGTSVLGGFGTLGALEGVDATLQLTASDLAGAMRATGNNFTASAMFVRSADAESHAELAGIPEYDLQPITVNVPLAEFPGNGRADVMDATVTILNQLARVTPRLRATAQGLRESAGRFGKANAAVLEQVRGPLGDGVVWNGVGQPSAMVVVDVNAKAMATGRLLAAKSAIAVDRFAERLETAHRSWQALWPSLDATKFDLFDDGKVSLKPGVELDTGDTSAEELTSQVKEILRFVEQVDLDSVIELTAVFGETPPVTTTADPGVLDEANEAYQDALGKLREQNPAWNLLDYLRSWADGYLTGPDGESYRFVSPCIPQGMTFEEWLRSDGWYTVDTRRGFDQLLPGVGADILFATFASGYGPIVAVDKQKTSDWAYEWSARKPEPGDAELQAPYRLRKDANGNWEVWQDEDDPTYQKYRTWQTRYDALSQALQAFERTTHANDHTYFGWEATFQKNIDGDTRVVFKTYQWLTGPNGSYLTEKFMYIGADGNPVFLDASNVEHETYIGPAD